MPGTTGSFTFINLTVVWCLGGLSDGVPADAGPEWHWQRTMPRTTGSFTFINLTVVWCLGGLSDIVPADA
jgi:hypothetical protein